MRVLHVSPGTMFGGTETFLVTLARTQRLSSTMETHFALCFEGRLEKELVASDAFVHRIGGVRVIRPATVWRARRALRDLLQGGEFDLVICHSAWTQVVFGQTVRSAGLPLVFFLHDAVRGTHWLERWARLTPPDLAICNIRFTEGTLANLYPSVPSEVLYCPVAPPQGYSRAELSKLRSELETPQDGVVIIQVSRMQPLKGQRVHLEALRNLRDMPGWVCWQVGGAQRSEEAQYLDELTRAAAELKIGDRVRFLGQRDDVGKLLAAADVFCQPNTLPEGFGITFVEAMYAGVPIVTSAIGGAREVVNESCGVLVQADDPDALADALRPLLQGSELRERLGRAGPDRARSLSDPAAQVVRLAAILARTCQRHSEI
ncbi:glycosyltransferase [soil metagenome]